MRALFLALVAAILCVAAGRSARNDYASGVEKLRGLKGRVRDGVVTFDTDLYTEVAVAPERPYHLFLLFTALGEKYACEVCQQVHPEFTVLAESVLATGEKGRDGFDIFFGVVDFDANQGAYGIHGFTSAPQLVYVGPDRTEDTGKKLPTKIELPANQIFSVYTQGKSAESMMSYVKEKTGVDAPVLRSKALAYAVLFGVLVVLGVIAHSVWSNLDMVLNRLRRKRVWLAISFLFYGLSVSGMVYCIIREPPAFSQERNGKITFFHPQGRQQFVVEGLIVGGYDIVAALSVILMSQSAVAIKNTTLRYLALGLCLAMFLVAYRQMVSAYAFKNPWYESWY
ncbi:hypothetical protein SPRG_06888 [Saprolegnia parasitica CBS 223.65]|uniref:Thioredoxin domain-containing protein n=1 Tax=Saprolegnia parasitica (strain CBS 223.65) TaxID=695850 RepID=A0A067CAV2_SAPPC|nr:hypothetical protein SPRG_06888 [Saprolegnia parasitica CBS 223.65]KDO27618.1 hypothetical protein SPRG_06888 [Saprolegnia parasitica CBS 223.65]|eukprot:XP_012201740.1 hypothetical protein SPRG_06888 [Saprolegnia parasitica CBS 223.65]